MITRRDCRASSPFSAVTGVTDEARSAGVKPNSAVTNTASTTPNDARCQSKSKTSRTGISIGSIIAITAGAAHQATSAPSADAPSASIALSTSTSCIKRARPAPIDTRSAISLARDRVCPVSRLPTVAHAITSTSTTSAMRMRSGLPRCFWIGETPWAAGRSEMVSERNASIVVRGVSEENPLRRAR